MRNHYPSLKHAKRVLALMFVFSSLAPATSRADGDISAQYRQTTARIISEATSEEAAAEAWSLLAELTDKFPGRFSGSENLERAIAWTTDLMIKDGLANVHVEEVAVPHWVRGEERASVVRPFPQPLSIAALGGSIGTGREGVEAPVLAVRSFEELDERASDVKGKIVLYNAEFDEAVDPMIAYRQIRQYRGSGASRAAAHGAMAVLVRSAGPIGHRTPHTGGMRYADDLPKIPAAALAAEDANMLQRMQDRDEQMTIHIFLGAKTLPDAVSGNIVADIPGRERPDEFVLLGCHIDSWDISPGAMDDGGGCVAIWEAARVIKRLKLQPRRTIRIVFFTNEENGLRGGRAYLERHRDALSKHMLAMESDHGALPILGYGFEGAVAARPALRQIVGLLTSLGGTDLNEKFSGSDVMPLVRTGKVPGLAPDVEMSRYFYLHHTAADTADKVDPAELARLTAAMASIAFVVADMEEPLARESGK